MFLTWRIACMTTLLLLPQVCPFHTLHNILQLPKKLGKIFHNAFRGGKRLPHPHVQGHPRPQSPLITHPAQEYPPTGAPVARFAVLRLAAVFKGHRRQWGFVT